MKTFVSLILLLYVLYYTAILIYDLFLKQRSIRKESSDLEFILQPETEDKGTLQTIGIDDVEDLKTPSSFENFEEHLSLTENEKPDINFLREQFESEQDIEAYTLPQKSLEKSPPLGNDSKKSFKDLLNQASTNVIVVEDYEGQKVYNSLLVHQF